MKCCAVEKTNVIEHCGRDVKKLRIVCDQRLNEVWFFNLSLS